MNFRNLNTAHLSATLHRGSGQVVVCLLVSLFLFLFSTGCSTTKHVPEGQTILQKVQLKCDNKHVKPSDYRIYVRQEPNAKWFSLFKVPLGFYNMSGSDSTKRWNRFIRRLGEAPVCYSPSLTEVSRQGLQSALQANGYLHGKVYVDTLTRGRKTRVNYTLHPGPRYYINRLTYTFDNDSVRSDVLADTLNTLLRRGAPLTGDLLSSERNRIIRSLRAKGYYMLNKEYISYTADTTFNNQGVNLTLHFARPDGLVEQGDYDTYRIRKVTVYEDVEPDDTAATHSNLGPLHFHHKGRIKVHRRVYSRHLYVQADSLYREPLVQNTYTALGGLSAIAFSSVRMNKVDSIPGLLDCQVNVRTNKPHTLGLSLEGTNTSGDLGAAVFLTYSGGNFMHGSELLTVKLRGAYEAIRGLEGYAGQDYIEYSGEVGLQFPTFRFPGISHKKKQQLKASSILTLLYNSQNRPEFHRRLLTAGWGYKWQDSKHPGARHRFDLINVNYIFMPWISDKFRKEYLEGDDPHYAILRYSYENLLIMNMAYNFIYNSQQRRGPKANIPGAGGYQIKVGAETAGNLLHGIASAAKLHRDAEGRYNVLGIAYSQYAKFDFDYAGTLAFDDRNSLAFHTAIGVVVPYGNSSIVPYEKRYFSGGANSVRGWSVRGLGPGGYKGTDGRIDFINQTGNIRLDLSVEYRTRLFWQFAGAVFVDAGNVWNIRDYPDQPNGVFRFNNFYRQIAVAYGLGIRFNLDYFVLRFDGGMKAVNPSYTSQRQHFPIIHPKFKRDFTFHFAVGLPF